MNRAAFLTYIPNKFFDVIFFGDSIYYFSWQRIKEILNRFSENLTQDGVFIVRTWTTGEKEQTMVHNIENTFHVVEKHSYADSKIVVLVFRPSANRNGAGHIDNPS